MHRRITLFPIILAITVALTGCGFLDTQTDTAFEEVRDVQVASRDDTPAVIIQMPNNYSNVAFKCHGTVGVYVTSNRAPDGTPKGRAISTVKDDPSCPLNPDG